MPPPMPPAWSFRKVRLTDHVPLYKGANDEIVTQYSMGDVEKIGLVKFDFLGLKTLTMIRRAETSDQ